MNTATSFQYSLIFTKDKGMGVVKRNRNLPIVILLSTALLLFLFIDAIRHIRVYVVYSSGIGIFMIVGLAIVVITALIVKGNK